MRCIKPNDQKTPHQFNNEYVLQQLKSFGVVAYTNFMRNGYTKRISFHILNSMYDSFIKTKPFNIENNLMFYEKLLLSIGFQKQEFKFGIKQIFFRPCKPELMIKLMEDSVSDNVNKFKKFMFQRLWKRLLLLYGSYTNFILTKNE